MLSRSPLGKTNLSISILSAGASPLGGVYGECDRDTARAVVLEALRRGINLFEYAQVMSSARFLSGVGASFFVFFRRPLVAACPASTAPFYGLTRSESALGDALAHCKDEFPRDAYLVCTKVGRYGEKDFDFSPERVTRSLDESLQRLQTSYVDLLICHDIEFAHSLDYIVSHTLPAMQLLKASGKARFIGVSGLPLHVLKTVAERAHPQLDFVLSYCHHTLLDDTLSRDLLPLLMEKGIGIINASPFAMGLLTKEGPQAWHPAPAEIKECAKSAWRAAEAEGSDLRQLALRFSLFSNPAITTTLVGMKNVEELEFNMQAVALSPTDRALAAVTAALAPAKNKTWPSGNDHK